MPKKLLLLTFICLLIGSSHFLLANSRHQINNPSSPYSSVEVFDNGSLLFENEHIQISKIYPNPTSEYAGFSYQLHDEQTDARIILRNVLGKEIATFRLDAHYQTFKIPVQEYVSGMYFYTLSINGQNKITRKFLVKH